MAFSVGCKESCRVRSASHNFRALDNQKFKVSDLCLATSCGDFEAKKLKTSFKAPGNLVSLPAGCPAPAAAEMNCSQDLQTPKCNWFQGFPLQSLAGFIALAWARLGGSLPVLNVGGELLLSLNSPGLTHEQLPPKLPPGLPPFDRSGGRLRRQDPAGRPNQGDVNFSPGWIGAVQFAGTRTLMIFRNSDTREAILLAFGCTPTTDRRY